MKRHKRTPHTLFPSLTNLVKEQINIRLNGMTQKRCPMTKLKAPLVSMTRHKGMRETSDLGRLLMTPPQIHPLRRKKFSRDLMRKHLLSTDTLMTLLKSAGNPVIGSGENVMGISKNMHPLANVFDPNNPQHILETNLLPR